MTKALEVAAANGGRFIAFTIDGRDFAIPINDVREIRAWSGVTPLPNAPDFIKGVMNLRGSIVPIVDVRFRFGLGDTVPSSLHVVIVSAINDHPVGLLVDGVSDILDAATKDVSALPEESVLENSELLGILTFGESLAGIVDVARLAEGAHMRQVA